MKKTVEIQDITTVVSVTNPQLSPNGKRAVYVHTTINEQEDSYIANLFHINLETLQHSQWTFGKGRISSPHWSVDGTAVAYLAEEDGHKQLYVLTVADGQINEMTNLATSIERFHWSPCGKKIWVNGILDKEQTTKQRYQQIGFLTIESKKIEQVLVGDDHYRLEAISHDEEKLVYALVKEREHDFVPGQPLYLYNLQTNDQTMLTENQGHFSGATFSYDDSKLAYFGNRRQYGDATQNELYIADLQNQTNSCLTEGLDAPVGDYAVSDYQELTAGKPVWTKDDHLYFQVSTMGDVRLYFASLDGMIFPASPEMEHVIGYDVSHDGEIAILSISKPTQPVELYRLKITTGEVEQLTSFNQDYVEHTKLLEGQPTITIGAIEPVHSWLIEPIDVQQGEEYPLIVKVHEGTRRMFANTFYHELQLLAAQGYGVLYVNPSGHHGYSQEFAKATSEFTYEDTMNAIAEVVETIDWIDENRLAVIGNCYGGLLTKLLFLYSKKADRSTSEKTEQLALKLENMEKDTKFVRFLEVSTNDSQTYKPSYRTQRLEQFMSWVKKYV
ncbi:S9 family peptidase [Planococcus donghaensis]|uniref:S9 family peptidase n=1 Tax=Planococcus donghaensis TaxID=414778 RepID=UPI003B513BC6